MTMTNGEEVEKVEEKPKVDKKVKKVELSPEHFASRQRAHDIKVQKFLAGGEF